MKEEETKEEETKVYKNNEGEYFEVGKVYQATVGYDHYGVWASREEAERHVKATVPNATPFEGLPSALKPLPDGQYYIQPRVVFSYTNPVAEAK